MVYLVYLSGVLYLGLSGVPLCTYHNFFNVALTRF